MNLDDLNHYRCIICGSTLSRCVTFYYCDTFNSFFRSHFVFTDKSTMRLIVDNYIIHVDFAFKNISIRKNKILNINNIFNISEFDCKFLKFEEQCAKMQKVENKLKLYTAKYNKNHIYE